MPQSPHLLPATTRTTPALVTVRAYSDATFAGIVVNQNYLNPTGEPVNFWTEAPTDAGARPGLLWMQAKYAGTATPARRGVIFNRVRAV